MEIDTVQSYFNSDPVVAHYEAAAQKSDYGNLKKRFFSKSTI